MDPQRALCLTVVMDFRGQASETSPLLGPQHGNILPEHAPEEDDVNVTGGDNLLERQQSVDHSRAAQFAGNPEVTKQLKFILPAVSIGVFLSAADQTIIASSYGKIGSDLQALNLTSWIATSYFLTLTSFQPLYGKLSDIFRTETLPAIWLRYIWHGDVCSVDSHRISTN